MILSAQSIRTLCRQSQLITPFHERAASKGGMTYGLSSCGYDIRLAQDITIPNGTYKLASSVEHFNIPINLCMRILDKSSWARHGLFVQNTIAEPGWRGFLTLELSCLPNTRTPSLQSSITIRAGEPIAQVIFEKLDLPTKQPYKGRYQDQQSGAQPASCLQRKDGFYVLEE